MRSKLINKNYKLNRLQKFDFAYKDYEASLLIDKILDNIDSKDNTMNITDKN